MGSYYLNANSKLLHRITRIQCANVLSPAHDVYKQGFYSGMKSQSRKKRITCLALTKLFLIYDLLQ